MAHRVQSTFGSSPMQSTLSFTRAAARGVSANYYLLPLLALLALVLPSCGGGGTAPAPQQQTAPLAISSVSGISEGAELAGTVELAMAVSGGVGTPALTMATASAVIAHGSGTTLSLDWDTTQLADGAYQVCFLASDAQHQTATRAFAVTIDNSAPADGGGTGGEEPATPEPEEPAAPPPAFGGAIPLIAASAPVAGDAPPQFVVISGLKPGGVNYGLRRIDLMVVDDHGIATQTLYRGSDVLGSAAGSTLSLAWDTHTVADGPCQLQLDVLDTGGNLGRCDIAFSVDNSIDRDPPQLRDIRISYNEEYGNREFEIYAEDDQGLAYIALSLDGREVARSATSPLRFTLDPLKFEVGQYYVTYIAADLSGKQDTETDHSIFVYNDALPRYEVSGCVRAPNGDPLPNCEVRIWQAAQPYDPYYGAVFSKGWTDAEGNFTLSYVPPGTHPLTIESRLIILRQDLVITGDIELPEEATTLRAEAGPDCQVARLAVVTGADEGLEDFLAKLGFGETDSQGRLVRGTERFTLVDGDNSLPDGAYANCDEFLRQSFEDTPYDQLLIAAGNHYEDLLLSDIGFRGALARWHAVAPSSRFQRDFYLGGSAYDFYMYSPQLYYAGEINFCDAHGYMDWPLPLNAAQSGPELAGLRLTLPGGSSSPLNGWRQNMLDWLAARGFAPDEDGLYALGPLAAGWTVSVPNQYMPGGVLAYADVDRGAGLQPFRWQIACDDMIFSALPVPKQPSPEFSLQERLLEYALFCE